MRDWYDYSYPSHLLTPKPRVYAARTADGRRAPVQFVGSYCPGALPGCVTFPYLYPGAGGVDLRPRARCRIPRLPRVAMVEGSGPRADHANAEDRR